MSIKLLSDSDWYKLQKSYHNFDAITPDIELYNRIIDKKASVDLTRSHDSLRHLLRDMPKGRDIIVISNVEISKLPLEKIITYVKNCYINCQFGVYVSLLSYYITPSVVDSQLPHNYSHACSKYFNNAFDFANQIENLSCITDYPIYNSVDNHLKEGSNFLFVHPNIRYWLWK